MSYLGQVQNLDWASPSRIFATTAELFDTQPNYEHEVAIALDTYVKYQGIAPIVGGWGFATGASGPVIPPTPPPVNDQFTKLLLEFDNVGGGWHEYRDTNAAGVPRTWTQLTGMGRVTTEGEKFYPGALLLDGETVITAPDAINFDFGTNNFTIRGWFFCDFPVGVRRVLTAKSDRQGTFMFWADRTVDGFFSVGVGTAAAFIDPIVNRLGDIIVDRFGNMILARGSTSIGSGGLELMSATVYSDSVNPGWHEFNYTRQGSTLSLEMDGVEEDTETIGSSAIPAVPGPITIGGYGPPINGVFHGLPWIGMLDRFAIDFGVAR